MSSMVSYNGHKQSVLEGGKQSEIDGSMQSKTDETSHQQADFAGGATDRPRIH